MRLNEKYMQDLKQWLHDTSDSPLEEMSEFFTKRLDVYEEHMSAWEKSYQMFSEVLPSDCQKILDLGCGTGLELDKIRYDFGYEKWDAVISFQSLHHFLPERKKELYRKICNGLKPGGIFLLGDYIACCDEEEELLRSVYLKRRKQFAISENSFVHFDIPLTLEHERELLQNAGFVPGKVLDNPDGATIILSEKED